MTHLHTLSVSTEPKSSSCRESARYNRRHGRYPTFQADSHTHTCSRCGMPWACKGKDCEGRDRGTCLRCS